MKKRTLELFDYQRQGVEFVRQNRRAYIAFDMGMGKTITAIETMKELGEKNVLLIAEKNEIVNSRNFEKEVEAFFPDLDYVNLRDETEGLGERWVGGVNPDALVKMPPKLLSTFDTGIIDEATLAKNTSTVRFKRIRKICKGLKYLALLSGTPMMNGASEIFAPLVLLDHWLGGDGTAKCREAFETIFAGGFRKQVRFTGIFWQDFQWWAKGANNLRELRWLTQEVFLFKSKSETDVFKKKDRKVEMVPMNDEWAAEYNRAWDEYLEGVRDHNRSASRDDRKSIKNIKELQAVIENGQVYQVSSKWKAKRVAADIAEGKYGKQRMVVFSMFIETDQIFQSELARLGVSYRPFEDIAEWKLGTEQVLVGRLKSHAKGANIPEASVALFIDMDFVPTNNIQAENRIDRPEQTRDMTVRYYMAEGHEGDDVIDKHVQKIVRDKMKKIDEFMRPITLEERFDLPEKVEALMRKYPKEFRLLRESAAASV